MNNIEMANQIADAAEFMDSPSLDGATPENDDESIRHITNLRHIAQELAGSRGGELYPLPACDEP